MLENDGEELDWDLLDLEEDHPAEVRIVAKDGLWFSKSDIELIDPWIRYFGFSFKFQVDKEDGHQIRQIAFRNTGRFRPFISVLDESEPGGTSIVSFSDWRRMLLQSNPPYSMRLYYPALERIVLSRPQGLTIEEVSEIAAFCKRYRLEMEEVLGLSDLGAESVLVRLPSDCDPTEDSAFWSAFTNLFIKSGVHVAFLYHGNTFQKFSFAILRDEVLEA